MVSDRARLFKRADDLEHTLGLLNRLTGEAGALLDVLGSGVFQLTELTAPIHARASALTIAQANIAASKQAADELLEHLDTSRRVQLVLEQGPGRDLNAFLDALQQLEQSNKFLQAHGGLAAVRQALNHSQAVFDGALAACDADFRATLAAGTKASAPSATWLAKHSQEPITGDNTASLTLQLVSPQLLPKLNRMAALLLEANHTVALAGYAEARSRALGALLHAGGKDIPPLGTLQALPPEQLDRAAHNWMGQLRLLALLLLRCSRCWTCTSSWTPPFPPSPPSLGDSKLCKALVLELASLRGAVATAASAAFAEYEEAVVRDASKVVVADGTIHPVCAQVLSYVKRLLTHENAQAVLWPQSPNTSPSAGSSSGRAAMAAAVARVLERLVENLGAKARMYKSDALGALFMMNNVHYMTWSVEGSTGANGALELLGRAWVEKRKDLVEDYGAKYHDLTWMPLVKLLQAEMPAESDGVRLKSALKERYTRFNETLERICTSQSGWTIPDPALKAAVKRVVKDDLIQPYQEFLRRYADAPFTQHPAKYIRYAAADVAALVDDELFESKAAAAGAQGSKLSILRKVERLDSLT